MTGWTVRILVIASVLSAITASAQTRSLERVGCNRAPAGSPGAVIEGVVLNDSTSQPVRYRSVSLNRDGCTAITNAKGEFAFVDLLPGDYIVHVASLGFRRFAGQTVSVAAGETKRIEARVRPENRVADCLEVEACAQVLRHTPPESLADSDRLEEAALRTSIAIIVSEGWRMGDFYICLNSSNTQIASSLMSEFPKVVSRRECALSPLPMQHDSRLAYKGERAVSFSARIISKDAEHARAEVGNYVGPLWAAGWTCEFKREKREWIPVSCKMDWIS